MNHAKQDYSFAIDDSSHLIKINEATKTHNYYCPHCNSPMIPRKGEKNTWHFAHKPNIQRSCNYESYLHKLTKLRIKKAFDDAEKFHIKFSPKFVCNVTNCPLNIKSPCSWNQSQTYQIKKFYDTCSLEKDINGFIGDLVLSSSVHPERDPIVIEIYVTHKSTKEKLNSGFRIIEIKVESEDSIDDIIESNMISEKIYFKDERSQGIDIVKFINFRGTHSATPHQKHQHYKFHFWIDERLYYQLSYFGVYDKYSIYCLSPINYELENSIFRIDAAFPLNLDFAFRELEKSGLGIRFCKMCKYYKFNGYIGKWLCILYKSRGTQKYPHMSMANSCPHYSVKKFKDDDENIGNTEFKVFIKK